MRIIGGVARGRKIEAPKGMHTRPTSDRMREALFNILGPEVAGACVLDMFAGSGALGLEAWSRGASKVHFCDNSAEAQRVLRQNIELVESHKPAGIAQLHTRDAFFAITKFSSPIDLAFVDPPFAENLWEKSLRALKPHLAQQALVCCEHPKEQMLEAPMAFQTLRTRNFGNSCISVLCYTKEGSS